MKKMLILLCASLGTFSWARAQHHYFSVDRALVNLKPAFTTPKSEEMLSISQALKVFTFVKDSTGIEFNYSYAGCEKRAHAISLLLKKRHIPHRKIWNIEPGTMNFVAARNQLHVSDRSGLNGKVVWPYHVAILLFLKDQERADTVVVDPAISDKLIKYK